MNNSIPLKEIVGFLPYKLEVQYINTSTNRKIRAYLTAISMIDIETTYKRKIKGCSGDLIGWTGHNNVNDLKFKPIVRPLSELTKEITHNGETFVPALELVKLKEKYGKWKDIAPSIPYEYKIIKKPFGNMLKVTKLDSWVIIMSISEIERSEYFIVEKLKEWKFDIYDWIKEGKAIDINTL